MAMPDISIMPTPFFITKEDQELAKSLIESIPTGAASGKTTGVVAILNAVAEGQNVTALYELPVEQAAELLGILELELNELLDAGEIESRIVGGERMVIAGSLYQYRQEMKRLQNEGLDELVRQAEKLGLYE